MVCDRFYFPRYVFFVQVYTINQGVYSLYQHSNLCMPGVVLTLLRITQLLLKLNYLAQGNLFMLAPQMQILMIGALAVSKNFFPVTLPTVTRVLLLHYLIQCCPCMSEAYYKAWVKKETIYMWLGYMWIKFVTAVIAISVGTVPASDWHNENFLQDIYAGFNNTYF